MRKTTALLPSPHEPYLSTSRIQGWNKPTEKVVLKKCCKMHVKNLLTFLGGQLKDKNYRLGITETADYRQVLHMYHARQ